jgi:hypothetical protein
MSFLQETQRLKIRKTRVVPILPGPRPDSQVKTAERWAHWAAQPELRLCPPRRHQSTCKSSLSCLQRAFSWPAEKPELLLVDFCFNTLLFEKLRVSSCAICGWHWLRGTLRGRLGERPRTERRPKGRRCALGPSVTIWNLWWNNR